MREQQRATIARHGRLRAPSVAGSVVRLLAISLAVVVIAAGAVVGFTALSTINTLQTAAVDLGDDPLPPSIEELSGGVNLLVVGTDSCENQDLALFPQCAESQGGERNDVTMLLNISPEPRRVTVVSFPRDMVVEVPSCTSDDPAEDTWGTAMINTSYNNGGLGCTVRTVEELTGLDIQFAAATRWTGVIAMSDAIGGVDVCIADEISDRHTNLHLTPGNRTLVGHEALQFLRIRHGIGDGSDLGRISNQQQFMSSLARKLGADGVLGDVSKLFSLASTAIREIDRGQVVLDTNLASPDRMVQIAFAMRSVPFEDFTFLQYPTGADGDDVVPIRDAAEPLMTALRDNIPVRITGDVSPVAGVAVGEPTDGSTDGGAGVIETPEEGDPVTGETPQPDPAASTPAVPAVIDLPSEITGQTANQKTCTQAER